MLGRKLTGPNFLYEYIIYGKNHYQYYYLIIYGCQVVYLFGYFSSFKMFCFLFCLLAFQLL